MNRPHPAIRNTATTTEDAQRRLRLVGDGQEGNPAMCSDCHGPHAFATSSLTVRDARGQVVRVISMRGATS